MNVEDQILYNKGGKMNSNEIPRKIPEALRIQIDPKWCGTEKAIARFINRDTDIHEFVKEIEECRIADQRPKQL